MPRPITFEDMADFTRLADVQISPDGALIAFVAGEYFKTDTAEPKSHIWIVPTAGGAARPFTDGPRTDDTPRWSPDGRTLAFRSDRGKDGNFQIYLLDREGGEPRQVTDLPKRPSQLAWSPDGSKLAFLMTDPESETEKARKAAKNDAIEVEKHHRWQRVWTLDLATGETSAITGDVQVWEFAWMSDGGFALVLGDEPYEWSWFLPRLAHVDATSGVPTTLYSKHEKQIACPRVSPDGRTIAFLSAFWSDRGINGGHLLLIPANGGEARVLTEGYNGNIWWMQWTPDCAALDYWAYEDGQATVGRIDAATGERTTRWQAGAALHEAISSTYIACETGTFAALLEHPDQPMDIWVAAPPADADAAAPFVLDWQRRTDFHPQIADLTLGETRELRWTTADDLTIQGLLVLPVGYEEGQRVPLLTWVHGGPAWLYTHGFYGAGRSPQHVFAGAGYAVLMPNPRGSVGWGVAFLESNIADFGGRDFEDIVAGIDNVVALGIADPERLGIGGWSYGGYMSAWAVGQTTRFKAAMVGAAITNWRSFHGAAEIGSWDAISLRASPFELGGIYDQRAPLSYIDKVNTPTLLIHGKEDMIVPVEQSYEFFRALKDHDVPVELVVYPREPHIFQEREHNLDRFRRMLAWFQRYV